MIEFAFCGCEPYFKPPTRRENFGYVCCTWRKNNPPCSINAWPGKSSHWAFSQWIKSDHCSWTQLTSLGYQNAQIIFISKKLIFERSAYQYVLLHIRVTEMGTDYQIVTITFRILFAANWPVEIHLISLFNCYWFICNGSICNIQGKVKQEYAGLIKLRILGNQGLLLCAKRMHNSVQKHV